MKSFEKDAAFALLLFLSQLDKDMYICMACLRKLGFPCHKCLFKLLCGVNFKHKENWL